jgi:hypothetical protein
MTVILADGRSTYSLLSRRVAAHERVDTADGLLRFLKTERPLDELRVALAVIREFKSCESPNEWAMPIYHWTRLEQLEDF